MKLYTIVCLLFLSFYLNSQSNFNLELMANVKLENDANDIWGYVDENGVEYAIVGTVSNTLIFNLANPSQPVLIATINGARSIWRDLKSYKNYIYVVADQGEDGLLVIDMKNAPETITSKKMILPTPTGQITRCHNLYIDQKSGILFFAGCNISGAVLAFDLKTDPENPSFINKISSNYSHDVFVQDEIVFSSEINNGQLAIFDIADIQNPKPLGTVQTTGFFTHNAWANEDNTFVYTTDEVSNGTIDAYDITDLKNPRRVDAFIPESEENKGTVVHNTHFINDFLVTSWYSYGVVITDVSNPNKIIEVGHYDTELDGGPGCWGVYPYLPSGLIIASDITNGLFVLKPTYKRASFLSGKVTDKATGAPIFNAQIRIISDNPNGEKSDPQGNYTIGQLNTGIFEISFDHPLYNQKKATVELKNGMETVLNIQLEKSKLYTQNFRVIDNITRRPISEADIKIENSELTYDFKSDSNGNIVGSVIEGEYEIVAGSWGYKYASFNKYITSDNTYTIVLFKGYEDDFIFDYQWETITPNERSRWVREIPIPTFYDGNPSNVYADVWGDFGHECYLTGNGMGGTGQFDVDDGTSILISPMMDLTEYTNAWLTFRPWFFNAGGSGTIPNDSFNILAFNGTEKVLLKTIHQNTDGWGEELKFDLSEFLSLNNSVQIFFEASDDASDPHLVEAGIDVFKVSKTLNFEKQDLKWSFFPNPVQKDMYISYPENLNNVQFAIFSINGKLVSKEFIENTSAFEVITLRAPENSGIYVLNILSEGKSLQTLKFIKI